MTEQREAEKNASKKDGDAKDGDKKDGDKKDGDKGDKGDKDNKGDMNKLAKKQEDLANKAEKMDEALEDAAKALKEHYPEASEEVSREANKLKNEQRVSQDMQQAAQAMKGQKGQKALDKQHQALNKMRERLDQLQQSRGKMQKKEMEINLEAILTLLYSGVELANQQQKIAPVPSPLDVTSSTPATTAARREACRLGAAATDRVWRGARTFERSFEKLFNDELLFKAAFLTVISELVESLSQTKYAFEQVRYYSGVRMARQSNAKLTLILYRLMELARQLKNMAQQQGASSFLDQMEQMIKRQQQLNQMTQQQGQRPKADPLMQHMFNQMMTEQMMVRRSLEKLAGQYDEAKRLEEQLAKLAEEMKDVEKRLEKYDASAETQNKQKKIVAKMLDYSRSLHKQDFSRKRKGKTAGDVYAKPPPSIPSDLREIEQRLFNNLSRGSFPVEYRELIDRYLNSFSGVGR